MEVSEESLAERQENELQILQAIYDDDVKDVRRYDAWKVCRPPELRITLRPQESMAGTEAHVGVVLHVQYPISYPDELPELKLEDAKGLSDQHLAGLLQELNAMARNLRGEVMILELCQCAQKFLHAHNKPPSKSFYDEMISNQRKQEEHQARQHQKKMELLRKKEEKQRQQIEDEILKRQAALRLETRRLRAEAKESGYDRHSLSEPSTPTSDVNVLGMTPIPKDTEQRSRSSASPDPRTPMTQAVIGDSGSYHKPERKRRTSTPRRSSREDVEEVSDCQSHTGTLTLVLNNKSGRRIHRGRCVGHSSRGSTVYAGMDTKTGELVAIAEWTFRWRNTSRRLDVDDKAEDQQQANKYMKQVQSIEQELLSLIRLHHKNLVHYQALMYQQEVGKITVYVIMEYVGGWTLEAHLKSKVPNPVEILRHYTIQLVEVFCYLHNKAVVHKDLRASSVLLDSQGCVRLSDYSLDKRLQELCDQVDKNRPGVHFEDKTDHQPPTLGRGGKKGDIYRLGLLLLSMVEGRVLTKDLPEVPSNQPAELQDFLTKCLIKDERHRWSAHQLLDHTFIKTPLYSVVSIQKKPATGQNGENGEPAVNGAPEDDEADSASIPFIPTSEGGHSRLKNEFEILKWLGKGGFGDVIKVQNKLDSRYYAIKRIPLNPKSRQFTRKITREVKLLSRLNHENVVRYYNSWIETSEELAESSDVSTTFDTGGTTPSTSASAVPFSPMFPILKNSLGVNDDFEKLAPARVDNSVEWSISCSNHVVGDMSSSSEEDEDEDENDVFGRSFLPNMDDSDDGIVFEQDSKIVEWPDPEESKNKSSAGMEESSRETLEILPKLQFLYIQMEFCEKSTLRNCIDAGLYQDMDRMWRLFREIIEGLGHIHEQGMIHRDLKPVNIFLDSNDHVKIGDFGLATTDILTKSNILDITMNPSLLSDIGVGSSRSESLGDGSLTGKVGTALYVSPEMLNTTTKIHYNQKVDIYSLGVMFFEMCYKPLPTGMERVKILTNLRQPTIDLPEDFDEIEMPNQAVIIRWLLNHDPSKRPTSQELLQSECLPPPLMEEAELNEILRSTIANPESKAYKHMISAIFSQQVTAAMDFTFDIDLHKGSFSNVTHIVQKDVRSSLERIFCKHGAVPLATPLLMPRSKLYDQFEHYVCQMDHGGGLVALPYDLRIPFARYIARNNVTNLKRYCIERVYRSKKLFGLHPKELVECAFDIVTSSSTPSLIPDAEILHVVSEIIQEFPVLQNRNYYLRINHTSLLKGILVYCGVPEEIHPDVLGILGDVKVEKQKKFQVQTRLCSLSLSDEVVMNLYRFVETEGPFGKVASMLRCITKTKGHAGSYAKKGLHEMEAIITLAETLGCKLQPTLTLGLVYNVSHFSGSFFQVVCSVKRKRKAVVEVLAAGGRYDCLINEFKKPSGTSIVGSQSAVGVSISFEKVLAAVLEDEEFPVLGACEVLVCSLGHKDMIRDKLTVAKDLWAAGISADILHDPSLSLEEIQDYAKQSNIPYIVILKDLDSGTVKVRSTDKDNKVIEKKVHMIEVADYIVKLQQNKQDSVENVQSGSSKVAVLSQMSVGEAGTSNQTAGNLPPFTITFIPESTKIANNTKRRYESQIYSCISSALASISSKCRVEILALELTMAVLKTIAANLEVDGEECAFENSISTIVEKHARHRKYLTKVFDCIHELKFDKKSPVLLLYGLKDDSYRILL